MNNAVDNAMNEREERSIIDHATTSMTTSQGLIDAVMSGLIKTDDSVDDRLVPRLISNQPGSSMGDALRQELRESNSFDISVAFVTEGALKSLYQAFLDHAALGHRNRLITSTKNYFNDPKAFKELMKLKRMADVDVRIWERESQSTSMNTPFHPKGYVFTRYMQDGQSYYNLYVGSSNLTQPALQTQREWNLRVTSTGQSQLINQVDRELEQQVAESIPLTDEWIRHYEEDFQRYSPARKQLLEEVRTQTIEPNSMQREALERIASLRADGARRAIVISATGTGKTYLSAFDVRAYQPRRMLYVANRDTILKAARKSYARVLDCSLDNLGLLTGQSKEYDTKYVFATVDTLRRHMREYYEPDDFDYILIDEAHHSGAQNYKDVIEYFDGAEFMLGMTATPERLDGFNIFELFDYNIAYEIRLQQALDANLLCPFHYYGIAEYLGETQQISINEDSSASDKRLLQYELGELTSRERVRYIIRKIEEYGSYDQPVTGLVFCSRLDEAEQLSALFNQEINQQAERLYRTRAIKDMSAQEVEQAIDDLESGKLDYLFTVDKFNEGVDIPAINQIIMLRNTQSSIVFTQQLGRGLRKFPNKTCVTILDFIGNYTNNYLIPVALYGTHNGDKARKSIQRESIGLCSISFDEISRERVLKSIEAANWSDMARLREEYMYLRYEHGRIPMLADVYLHDPSIVMIIAQAKGSTQSDKIGGNYYAFARSVEMRIAKKKNSSDESFISNIEEITVQENAILKMATEILLPGLRPQELVILDELCGFTAQFNPRARSIDELKHALQERFPDSYITDEQFYSALRVLDYSYFDSTDYKRFGEQPLISIADDVVLLHPDFQAMLEHNATMLRFFADCVVTGLMNCSDVLHEAQLSGHSLQTDRGFVYEHKYKLAEVARLLGWHKEVNGQNIGGYKRDAETGSMPIFVKYANSQYADSFINPQELHWFSKDKRTPESPEFVWLQEESNAVDWADTHFIPLFVMRKEEKDKQYYYVGRVIAFTQPQLVERQNEDGSTVRLTTTNLRLDQPIGAELYKHLTGISEL